MERQPARSQRPAWLVVLVLCVIGVLSAFQFTMLIPLLGIFPALLGESVSDVQWLVTTTLLASAVTTPLVAKSADMFGKRRLLLICLALIMLGSVVAITASTLPQLIAARALQGVGGAVVPIGIAMMRDSLPPHRLGWGIALLSTTSGIGVAVGLPVGGLLYESFGWQAPFWATLIIAGCLLAFVPLAMSGGGPRTGGRFDWLGAVLLSIALVAALLVVSKVGEWGPLSPLTLGIAALAIAAAALWLLSARWAAEPIVELGTTFSRPVALLNTATFFLGLAVFGNMIITTAQWQVPAEGGGPGLSSVEAGLLMTPSSLALIGFSPLAGWLMGRIGAKATIVLGGVLTAIACVERIFTIDDVPWTVAGTILLSAGTALNLAATPALLIPFVPVAETTQANGVNSIVRGIGSAFGSAIIAAAFSVVAVTAAGVEYPTDLAFVIIFAVGAVTAVVSIALTLPIPRPPALVREGGAGAR